MDYVTLGLDMGSALGLSADLFTLYWRHVMLVPLRGVIETLRMLPVKGGDGGRLGAMVGFGAFQGRRQQYSHWFVVGAEVLWEKSFSLFFRVPTTRVVGLVLPVGYEFRHHFGRHLRWVWGVRAYLSWMPVAAIDREEDIVCEPHSMCKEQAPRVTVPLLAGVCLFIGI